MVRFLTGRLHRFEQFETYWLSGGTLDMRLTTAETGRERLVRLQRIWRQHRHRRQHRCRHRHRHHRRRGRRVFRRGLLLFHNHDSALRHDELTSSLVHRIPKSS